MPETRIRSSWDPIKRAIFGSWGDENRTQFEDRDYIRNTIQAGIAGAGNRQAPQADRTRVGQVVQGRAATIDTGPQAQFRQGQHELAQNLQRVASGQQQGAGELAVQRAAQRALGQAQGAATYGRGNTAASAARSAARAAAGININAAGQAQQAALGDQASARQLMAGVLGQGREQDIGLATGQAGLQQQMGLANMSAENQRIFQQAGLDQATTVENMRARLQAMGMNDAAIQGYLAQLLGLNSAEMGARMGDNGLLGYGLEAAGSWLAGRGGKGG